jgi:hypothetical protein
MLPEISFPWLVFDRTAVILLDRDKQMLPSSRICRFAVLVSLYRPLLLNPIFVPFLRRFWLADHCDSVDLRIVAIDVIGF